MINYLSYLEERAGLADWWGLTAPNPPFQPLWAMGIALKGYAESATAFHETSISTVGAYGLQRSDTVARAVGEAVERQALIPCEHEPLDNTFGGPADLSDNFRTLDALTLERDDGRRLWFTGKEAGTGDKVYVDAGLVDYPTRARDNGRVAYANSTPSGAASGVTFEMAARAAVLEIIERDGFMRGWYSSRATRVPLNSLLDRRAGIDPGDRERVAKLVRFATWGDSRLRVLRCPSRVPGVLNYAAIIRQGSHTAVGVKAHKDYVSAITGCVQEALQIRALMEFLSIDSPTSPDGRITGDLDRVAFWRTPEAGDDIDTWIASLPAEKESHRDHQVPTSELLAEDLLGELYRAGGDPVVVDLAPRLSPEVRRGGWAALKVIDPNFVPLCVDERFVKRSGIEEFHNSLPHPLI